MEKHHSDHDWKEEYIPGINLNRVAIQDKEDQLKRVGELYNTMMDIAGYYKDWEMCEYIKELTLTAEIAIKSQK